jgi:hypothetical protein
MRIYVADACEWARPIQQLEGEFAAIPQEGQTEAASTQALYEQSHVVQEFLFDSFLQVLPTGFLKFCIQRDRC